MTSSDYLTLGKSLRLGYQYLADLPIQGFQEMSSSHHCRIPGVETSTAWELYFYRCFKDRTLCFNSVILEKPLKLVRFSSQMVLDCMWSDRRLRSTAFFDPADLRSKYALDEQEEQCDMSELTRRSGFYADDIPDTNDHTVYSDWTENTIGK